jgi:hypothetical protein
LGCKGSPVQLRPARFFISPSVNGLSTGKLSIRTNRKVTDTGLTPRRGECYPRKCTGSGGKAIFHFFVGLTNVHSSTLEGSSLGVGTPFAVTTSSIESFERPKKKEKKAQRGMRGHAVQNRPGLHGSRRQCATGGDHSSITSTARLTTISSTMTDRVATYALIRIRFPGFGCSS